MTSNREGSTTAGAPARVGVLSAFRFVQFVVGAFIRLAQVELVLGHTAVGAYLCYEFRVD